MIKRILATISSIIIFCTYSQVLHASDSPSPFSGGTEERSERDVNDSPEEEAYIDSLRPMLLGGISIGGEHVGDLDSVNSQEDTVKAGGGWFLGGGFRYTIPGESIAFQSSFNIHYNGDDSSSGKSSITRFPLDFLLLYNFGQQSIGGGITYHLSPDAEVKVDGKTLTRKMEDAIGLLVEYNYRINDRYVVGARITDIKYKTKDSSREPDIDGEKLDAGNFAMTAYYFY